MGNKPNKRLSYTATNIFMNMIYEKVKPSIKNIFKYFSHRRKVKKFKKDIDQGSPSFGLLWKMSDFIKSAEEVFFYDNNKDNTDICLFSSSGYIHGENGFKINDPDCFVVIKLYSDTQRVVIEIERAKGQRIKHTMSFTNETWEGEPTAYDEMLLEQIIKMINKYILKLFDWCYERR